MHRTTWLKTDVHVNISFPIYQSSQYTRTKYTVKNMHSSSLETFIVFYCARSDRLFKKWRWWEEAHKRSLDIDELWYKSIETYYIFAMHLLLCKWWYYLTIFFILTDWLTFSLIIPSFITFPFKLYRKHKKLCPANRSSRRHGYFAC